MNLAQSASVTVFDEIVYKATIDPDWFCKEVLGTPNDIWQSELMNAVADLDRDRFGLKTLFNHDLLQRFTCRAFHGPGKTHWVAKMMHWWNFTRLGKVIVTAPKEKNVTHRVWPEFRKIKIRSIAEYQALIKVDKTMISWCGNPDWAAIAEAASTPENLAGYHDDWLLYAVEEASGVDQALFPVIEGALSTPNSVLLLIGNPIRTIGEFYDSHNKKGTMELYYRKGISHDETPRISQKWVDGMVAKYGKDSPVVQSRVFGNFCDTESNQLIPQEWLHDAIDREFKPDGSIPSFRVSIDVGDGGVDNSIISVGIHYETILHLRKQYIYNFPPSIGTVRLFEAASLVYDSLVDEFPDSDGDFVVDTAGVGTGTAGLLLDAGYPVVLYKGGAGSDDPAEWANRRTQSYLCYRDGLRDGQVVIADDYCDLGDWDDFFAQHVSIKTKEGDKVETLETKKELKARGIKSPDMPDAIKQHYATSMPTMGKGQADIIQSFPTLVDNDAF